MPDRRVSVDTLRGIAIFLLVAYHSREFIHSSLYTALTYCADPIRMPIFAYISGYLYSLRPAKPGNLRGFIVGKFHRIVVPTLVVLAIWLLLNLLIEHRFQIHLQGTDAHSLLRFFLYHPRTYWFVEGIFVVFLATSLLDRFSLLGSAKRTLSLIVLLHLLAILSYRFGWSASLKWFSLSGALYLAPYFLFGLSLGRFRIQPDRRLLLLLAAILAVLYALYFSNFEHKALSMTLKRTSSLAFAIGLLSILFLHLHPFSNRLFAFLGGYSLTIFLYHRFSFDITTITLQTLHLSGTVTVIFYIALGLLMPIALHRLVARHALPARLLLGIKSPETRRPPHAVASPTPNR